MEESECLEDFLSYGQHWKDREANKSLSRPSGFDGCVLTIEVEEGHTHGQEHDDGDDGDDDGDDGAGGRLLPLPSLQAARPPLSVASAWALAAGRVLEVALVEVPRLALSVRTVAAVPRRLAPVAGEVRGGREGGTGGAARLADARWQRLEHGHRPRVDVNVVNVDLVVEVKLGALEEESITDAGNRLVVVESGRGENRLHLDVDEHNVAVGSQCHLGVSAVGGRVQSLKRRFMKLRN